MNMPKPVLNPRVERLLLEQFVPLRDVCESGRFIPKATFVDLNHSRSPTYFLLNDPPRKWTSTHEGMRNGVSGCLAGLFNIYAEDAAFALRELRLLTKKELEEFVVWYRHARERDDRVTTLRRLDAEASTYGFKLTKRSKNDHSEEEVPI